MGKIFLRLLELCVVKFLKDKRMWGYVSGTSIKPIDKQDRKYELSWKLGKQTIQR